MNFQYSIRIDKGQLREQQQDAVGSIPIWDNTRSTSDLDTDHGAIFIVADGMGGAVSGDLAASLAVDRILEECKLSSIPENFDAQALLLHFIMIANESILDFVAIHPEHTGMGSTIVIGILEHHNLHIGWVGDSRCYAIRNDDQLVLLSHDHSYIQELIDKNQLSPELAQSHPNRNIITRSLGMKDIVPDVVTLPIAEYKKLLFCTDGINAMMSDEEIESTLNSSSDVNAIADQLINQANALGGHDNMTAIVVQFQERPIPITESKTVIPESKNSHLRSYLSLILFGILGLFLVVYFKIYSDSHQKHNTPLIITADTPVDNVTTAVLDTISYITDTPILENQVAIDTAKTQSAFKNYSYYIRLQVVNNKEEAFKVLANNKAIFPKQNLQMRRLSNGLYEITINGFTTQKEAAEFTELNDLSTSIILLDKELMLY